MLLLGALILGVLAMHSFVVAPAAHSSAPRAVAASWTATVAPDHAPDADMVSAAPVAATDAMSLEQEDVGGDATGHGSSSGLHDLMHLCMAVLAGVVLVIVAALLVLAVSAVYRILRTSQRAIVTRPAQPPPRTAVRLAQLCVLRT